MPGQQDPRTPWTVKAQDALVGKTVVEARYLTKEEVDGLGWSESVLVIIFNDGTMVFPSQDDEGNGGGALFGNDAKGKELTFPVIRRSVLPSAPAVVIPPAVKFSGPMTATHKNMLKRIKRGEQLHMRCGRTLGELKDLGYISMMARAIIGRTTHWKVALSEKGVAA